MKLLYKYPQSAYPYSDLVATNALRGRAGMEYELLDTGAFEEDRYFDVFVEYAETVTDRCSDPDQGLQSSNEYGPGACAIDAVISMPDQWEYPWFAAWDLAFRTIVPSTVDLDFANRSRLMLPIPTCIPNGADAGLRVELRRRQSSRSRLGYDFPAQGGRGIIGGLPGRREACQRVGSGQRLRSAGFLRASARSLIAMSARKYRAVFPASHRSPEGSRIVDGNMDLDASDLLAAVDGGQSNSAPNGKIDCQ